MSWRRVESAIATCRRLVQLPGQDPELDSVLGQYLIVVIVGAYEEIVEQEVARLANRDAEPAVAQFVIEEVGKSFRNPGHEQIKALLRKFGDETWSVAALRLETDSRTALEALMTVRNDIAHGKRAQVTVSDAVSYFVRTKGFIERVEASLCATADERAAMRAAEFLL